MTRILVVDDDARVRMTARALLEAAGFQVVEAESGDAALRVLTSEAVEVVLTDIFMPHTDGIELIHALRRESPELPIVAMSGGGFDGGKDVLSVARLLGAAGIVQKPLTQRKLVGAIRRALGPPRDEN
jgi:two-component system, chemotaxis family, chemotaxis protein CheY